MNVVFYLFIFYAGHVELTWSTESNVPCTLFNEMNMIFFNQQYTTFPSLYTKLMNHEDTEQIHRDVLIPSWSKVSQQ